ncbi:hypothetical protein HK096_001702, partial [Nowakowskiella sp. JEL0078]
MTTKLQEERKNTDSCLEKAIRFTPKALNHIHQRHTSASLSPTRSSSNISSSKHTNLNDQVISIFPNFEFDTDEDREEIPLFREETHSRLFIAAEKPHSNGLKNKNAIMDFMKVKGNSVSHEHRAGHDLKSLKSEKTESPADLDFFQELSKAQDYVDNLLEFSKTPSRPDSVIARKSFLIYSKCVYSSLQISDSFNAYLPNMAPTLSTPLLDETSLDSLYSNLSNLKSQDKVVELAVATTSTTATKATASCIISRPDKKKKKKNKKKKKQIDLSASPTESEVYHTPISSPLGGQHISRNSFQVLAEPARNARKLSPILDNSPSCQVNKPVLIQGWLQSPSSPNFEKALESVYNSTFDSVDLPNNVPSTNVKFDVRQDSKYDYIEDIQQWQSVVEPVEFILKVPYTIPAVLYPFLLQLLIQQNYKILSVFRKFENNFNKPQMSSSKNSFQRIPFLRSSNTRHMIVRCFGDLTMKCWTKIREKLAEECKDEDWLKSYILSSIPNIKVVTREIDDMIPDRTFALNRINTPRHYFGTPESHPHSTVIIGPLSKALSALRELLRLHAPGHSSTGSIQYPRQRPHNLPLASIQQTDLLAIKIRTSENMANDKILLEIISPFELGTRESLEFETAILYEKEDWLCAVVYGRNVEDRLEKFEGVIYSKNPEMYFAATCLLFKDMEIAGVYSDEDIYANCLHNSVLSKLTTPWIVTGVYPIAPTLVVIGEQNFSNLSEIWKKIMNVNGICIVGVKVTKWHKAAEKLKLIPSTRGLAIWIALAGMNIPEVANIVAGLKHAACPSSYELTWDYLRLVFNDLARLFVFPTQFGTIYQSIRAPVNYDIGNRSQNGMHFLPEISKTGSLDVSNWGDILQCALQQIEHTEKDITVSMKWRHNMLIEYPVLQIWKSGEFLDWVSDD